MGFDLSHYKASHTPGESKQSNGMDIIFMTHSAALQAQQVHLCSTKQSLGETDDTVAGALAWKTIPTTLNDQMSCLVCETHQSKHQL